MKTLLSDLKRSLLPFLGAAVLLSANESPKHAYHMHNSGYDLLPRMWQTFLIFGVMIVVLYVVTRFAIKKYNFVFNRNDN